MAKHKLLLNLYQFIFYKLILDFFKYSIVSILVKQESTINNSFKLGMLFLFILTFFHFWHFLTFIFSIFPHPQAYIMLYKTYALINNKHHRFKVRKIFHSVIAKERSWKWNQYLSQKFQVDFGISMENPDGKTWK